MLFECYFFNCRLNLFTSSSAFASPQPSISSAWISILNRIVVCMTLYCYVTTPFWDVPSLEYLWVEEQIPMIFHKTLIRQEVVTERERGGEGGWYILSGGFVLSFAARLQILETAEQSADARWVWRSFPLNQGAARCCVQWLNFWRKFFIFCPS